MVIQIYQHFNLILKILVQFPNLERNRTRKLEKEAVLIKNTQRRKLQFAIKLTKKSLINRNFLVSFLK